MSSLFPEQLQSSGYLILSIVALICAGAWIINGIICNQLLINSFKGYTTLKSITTNLYIQQLNTEYRLLVLELNNAETAVEKANTRTHIYNFLNSVCLEIVSSKDSFLATQIATSFFSKIHARYLKLGAMPDGIVYFQYIGQVLTRNNFSDIQRLVKQIRSNAKKEVKFLQDFKKETVSKPKNEEKPAKKNYFKKS